MTTRSALRRVVQVDRRSAKDDIKAIEIGMRSRADASTYFEEIEVQDRSPGIVVVRARREMAQRGGEHLRSYTAKHSLLAPRDLIGRRVRKAFKVADKEGRQAYPDFEGTVKRYSIPRQFFKVV